MTEWCLNCGELHNKNDCTMYMFHKEKYEPDKNLLDCGWCETPDEMDKANCFHEMKLCLCDSCSVIVNNDMLECHEIEGECPVCLEHKQLNILPCKHNLCFDCCKHIYIGVTDIERPMHCIELDAPLWPYVNAHLETIYNEFLEEHNLYDHDTLEEFSNHHTSSFGNRAQWMNEEAFIDYEYDVMQYILLYRETNKRWNEWMDSKTVGNGTCPLCRAEPIEKKSVK